MATATLVWYREGKQDLGVYATSGEADTAIRRLKGKREGKDAPSMTLDKVTVNVP